MKLRSNNIDFNTERLLITGSSGMVGKSLISLLPSDKILPADLPYIDLREETEVNWLFEKYRPTYVIHLAAKVGGLMANSKHLGDFYTDNIRINTNILAAACIYKEVNKVVSLLSTCIYPDKALYPLTEDQIHNGPPHDSNYAYAYAKRMLDIQSRACRAQYGSNFVTIVPNNLYGLFDNFDLENSHVLPAIIRKMYEAKINNKDVELWGDGSALREFTFADDLAEILLFVLEQYNDPGPMNIGNTQEYSIKFLAELIASCLEFDGKLIWNDKMPTGQLRKPSSNDKFTNFAKSCGKKVEYTPIETGLKKVCDWFVANYPNVRGAM